MKRFTAIFLGILICSSAAEAQVIYWKKDHIRDASGAIAVATPAPSDGDATFMYNASDPSRSVLWMSTSPFPDPEISSLSIGNDVLKGLTDAELLMLLTPDFPELPLEVYGTLRNAIMSAVSAEMTFRERERK